MDKSMLLIIILAILGIIIATLNTEDINNTLNDIKITLEGKTNQQPIAKINIIPNNSTTFPTNYSSKEDSFKNDSFKNYNNYTNNEENLININNTKIYKKNGISFLYPNYWNYDQLNKILSLYQKEYLSRWDDGLIFYISDNSLEEELKIQKIERFKQPVKLTVDGKKAYSLTSTKADYWHYLVIVQKNKTNTYVFIFYCDRELKKKDKILFNEILKTMQLR
ncbi:hypothetical protein SDC9_32125 [bioreactor metagenome]|uniref:Uncharacterized protein n=1 Tax=bioreactor metagenome TaxID=1076179 RepID=A0A644V478_9ZZZZ|nr:hypothetical protein [Methanobrevibacter sp.]MEA4958060.1 hypothetical protein [Methanobrevibacter sp.]